uniref:GIT domain-containing protein n=1 Tax=Macrostomum lignano TaxID=282301 RepID=A0A1I8I6A8_9PLAT
TVGDEKLRWRFPNRAGSTAESRDRRLHAETEAEEKAKTSPKKAPTVASPPQPAEEPAVSRPKDSLDYLAKYCIVHAHRIPAYESAFKRAAVKQRFRYDPYREIVREAAEAAGGASGGMMFRATTEQTADAAPDGEAAEGGGERELSSLIAEDRDGDRAKSASRLSTEEIYRLQQRRQVGTIPSGDRLFEAMRQRLEASLPPTGANSADCELAKLKFVLDSLSERLAKVNEEMGQISDTQTHLLAGMARDRYWDSLPLPDDQAVPSKPQSSVDAQPKLNKRRQQRKPGVKIDRDEALRIKRLMASLPDETVVQMLTSKQLS